KTYEMSSASQSDSGIECLLFNLFKVRSPDQNG
ncbi:unnamed protein product, partial [marine sediment metagenome]